MPEWMGKTNYFHSRDRNNKNLFQNSSSGFKPTVRQKIYETQPQVQNRSGQFEAIPNKKIRSKWEMKNNTFELEWPKR